MPFMSREEILEAIKQKEIRIAYYAVKDSQNKIYPLLEKQFVTLEPESDENEFAPIIRNYLKQSLKPDSVYFHIGPYALVKLRKRQEQTKYITEIERSDGFSFNIKMAHSMKVYPKEFVILGTNEYIEISENIGASVYSTVNKTNLGFSHISTIIDPTWEGYLQVGIANLSDCPQALEYLDRFCSIKFYRLSTRGANNSGEGQSLKLRDIQPHFANDWWVQEKLDKEMFPTGVRYIPNPTFLEKLLTEENWEAFKQFLVKALAILGVSGGLIVLLFGIGRLNNKLEDLDKVENSLDENTIKIVELKKDLENLDRQLLQIGASQIFISANQPSNKISIPFDEALAAPPAIFVEFDDLPKDKMAYNISYPITNSGNNLKYHNAVITISSVDNVSNNQNLRGTVRWLVVSRK